MKIKIPAIAAAVFCCMSCVEVNSGLGGSLVPVDQTYDVYQITEKIAAGDMAMKMADSLSGFNQTRITVGAIKDKEYGLTTRSSAFALVPLHDAMDFGDISQVKVKRMHFAAAFDTTSYAKENQRNIVQNVIVRSLKTAMDPQKNFDCNGTVETETGSIVKGNPVINGSDSLTFDFTEEYARRFLTLSGDDFKDIKKLTAKIPGIVISTSEPISEGGRINIFELQCGYDANAGYIVGNYAQLDLSCVYNGERKDTSFFFTYGLSNYCDLDSLFSKSSRGSYPQYAYNMTGQSTRERAMDSLAPTTETIMIEGGGGLKPVISAKGLKHAAERIIAGKGGDPARAVINKATLTLPFIFPEDYKEMVKYPQILSPTCRMKSGDVALFANLTDASSKDENQGDINRSRLLYEPDITYHVQELLKIDENPGSGESETNKSKRKMLDEGQFDIWFLILSNEAQTTTSSSSNNEMSEYYQYLAYQQYYNSMYGGYGGYGYGYGGYGGYGYDSYSNYYSYMLAAMYAGGGNSSSTSYTTELDKDRFYCAKLCGPGDPDRAPTLTLTFSLVKE